MTWRYEMDPLLMFFPLALLLALFVLDIYVFRRQWQERGQDDTRTSQTSKAASKTGQRAAL
jgi:flagellar biogenesis protein FliO